MLSVSAPQVQVRDASGNLVDATVTLSLVAGSGATMSPPSPSAATVDGVASFPNVAITVPVHQQVQLQASVAGAPGSLSQSFLVTTPPAAPTQVLATTGPGQATVAWSPPLSDGGTPITGYQIVTQPGGASTSVSATTVSAVVTGLANGTAYTFDVSAINAAGTGPATASSAVTPGMSAPTPPTAVSAQAGDHSALVTWQPSVSDGGNAITSYTVTATPGGASATVGGSATSATVPGLVDGPPYTFTVTATNGVGTSAPSAVSNQITPGIVPAAPTDVTAHPGDGQATISWVPSAASGSSPIDTYTVTSSPSGATATVSASVYSATVGGLVDGTPYSFTVVATNSVGSSPASATSNSVTPSTTSAAPGTPPTAPTDVRVTPGDGQVAVTWAPPTSAGTNPIEGYVVTSTPGNATQSVSASVYGTTVTGLSDGTPYTFSVVAMSASGDSPPATSAQVTPTAPVPGAPTSVLAIAGNGQVSVSWQAPSGGVPIQSYTVTSSPGEATATVLAPTTEVSLTRLGNGQAYQFNVVATGTDGQTSSASPSNTVTPSATSGPAVTAISPATGPVAGGTAVTITGTGFTGATAVLFGSAAATTFSVVSSTKITAAAPAGSGWVDVTVATASGTSATSPADQFGYPSAALGITRTLQPGWNTISVPFALQQRTLGDLFPDHHGGVGAFLVGYAFQNGRWQQLNLGTPTSVFAQPMTGFYLNVASAVTITLTPSPNINPPPSYEARPGWNLVGPSSAFGTQSYADFVGGNSGVLVDPNQVGVSSSDPTSDTSDQVTDGYAYWFFTNQQATLAGRISTPPQT